MADLIRTIREGEEVEDLESESWQETKSKKKEKGKKKERKEERKEEEEEELIALSVCFFFIFSHFFPLV